MILLLAQFAMVLMLTLWLSVGVHDNLRHPEVNHQFVAQVLAMTRLKEEFPELYALHANRAIKSERTQQLLFWAIVAIEASATLALWAGSAVLLGAVLGVVDIDTARGFGLFGTLAFTMIWSGFLVAGNYWCYWMCHEGAQNTHFQMTLWGIGVMVLLSV